MTDAPGMEDLFRKIESPALVDLSVQWPGSAKSELATPMPSDLYAGDPLVVLARISGLPAANQVLTLDKNNVPAMVLLAQLQNAEGSPDKAIALYLRAIELLPRDVRLQVALGALYERAGKWQEAESTYQKVLALDAENPLASNNLAYLLLEHGGSPNVALTLAQTGRRGKLLNMAFAKTINAEF